MPFISTDEGPAIMDLVRMSMDMRNDRGSNEMRRSSTNPGGARGSADMRRTSNKGSDASVLATRRISQEVSRVSQDLHRRHREQKKDQGDVVGATAKDATGSHDEHDEADKIFAQAPHDGLTSQRAEELLAQWGKVHILRSPLYTCCIYYMC